MCYCVCNNSGHLRSIFLVDIHTASHNLNIIGLYRLLMSHDLPLYSLRPNVLHVNGRHLLAEGGAELVSFV